MPRHANQRTNYQAVSPFESRLTGSYTVQKLIDANWTVMASGDKLDRLIRCAEAVGGPVRIVRKRGEVVVWERKASGEMREQCGGEWENVT